MKRIRYLSLLVLLFCGISVMGQTWTPTDNPPDPGLPPSKLTLQVSPQDAGSVSGSGKFTPGTVVSLRAYGNTGFRFLNWTDADGRVVSESVAFSYTKGEQDEVLTANYVFDPTAPGDPDEAWHTLYYQLTLVAERGGTVSGGGRYQSGNRVTVRAYPNTGYDFLGWYDEDGVLVSDSQTYGYTTTAAHRTLTARFLFNPDSPADPDAPIMRYHVTLTAGEGGTVNFADQRVAQGESVLITATCNTGYRFDGWYLAGERYTNLASFTYRVGQENVNFEARFVFDPASPDDPAMPATKKYAFYLMNKVCKPGDTVDFPIYLTSLDDLSDMTFQLTFPAGMQPDFSQLERSDKAAGYDISWTSPTDTTYVFTLVGGTLPAGNTCLLLFRVPVPSDIGTGTAWPVKINQVSVVEQAGSSMTASTRNGRISVYKRGDTNGDDKVNVVDVTNMSAYLAGDVPDVFIDEVSDVNEDGKYSVVDVTGICEIIAKGEDYYEEKLKE